MSAGSLKFVAAALLATTLAVGGYFGFRSVSPAVPKAAAAPPTGDDGRATPQPDKLPGRILVCQYNQFAWLEPGRSEITRIGDVLEASGYIVRHRLAPDGKSVAFLHEVSGVGPALGLWQFDQPWPGKVLKVWKIAPGGRDFFWMPDGKHILIGYWEVGKDGIPTSFSSQLLDVATRKVTDLKLPDGHWPADVSPDGKWFLTMTNSDPKDRNNGGTLYRVSRSGTDVRKLRERVTMSPYLPWRFSPDGTRVAGLQFNRARKLQVFVVDLQLPGTFRQVSNEDARAFQLFGWSPDGKKLLYHFSREPARPKPREAFEEFIVTVDGDGKKRKVLHRNERHYTTEGHRSITDSLGWADWR